MEWLRRALHRLGWPVDCLSDDDVARELAHRWFATGNQDGSEENVRGAAAANGIFVSMARDGNLDALCWSREDDAAFLDEFTLDQACTVDVKVDEDPTSEACPWEDRRSQPRGPADDLIEFGVPAQDNSASGWLVDASANGIAFMAETDDVPTVGMRIVSTIRKRGGETAPFGCATVVRTELLTDRLSLVCAQRIDP